MPEDKLIKTGQITWSRVLFMLACGVILVVIVATGQLSLGYVLLTAVLCVLLFLVMIDYHVQMGTVDLSQPAPQQNAPVTVPDTATGVEKEVRPRRRTSRPAKRRR